MLFILFVLFTISNHDKPKNSTFSKNIEEGCIYDYTYLTKLYSTSILCFYRCTFRSINSQLQNGGAIYVNLSSLYDQSHIISNCIFEHCTGASGGSIYIQSTHKTDIKLISSRFYNNSANQEYGGSTYFKRTTFSIANCSFIQNIVYRSTYTVYGGSNYFTLSNGTIESSTFCNNIAHIFTISPHILNVQGGSIYFDKSSVKINECTFTNNTSYATSFSDRSTTFGGAISMIKTICNLSFCDFYNNTGTGNETRGPVFGRGGCICIHELSNVHMNNCHFDHNSIISKGDSVGYVTDTYGGSIYAYHSVMKIEYCKFTHNFCLSEYKYLESADVRGGAFFSSGTNVTINFCYFYDNLVNLTARREYWNEVSGGAIAAYGIYDGKLIIFNSEFINNTIYINSPRSQSDGGSIHTNCYSHIKDCSFINSSNLNPLSNYKSNGGALHFTNCIIDKCIFINCIATLGGDFYYDQLELNEDISNISNCEFKETIDRYPLMTSLFYFELDRYQIPFNFTNNKIFITNTSVNNIWLINGSFYVYAKPFHFIMHFNNNCIYPYYKDFFITDEFRIYDTENKSAKFEKAFESVCTFPTYSFTQSNLFTKSTEFTKSYFFTKSNEFTNSKGFTKSAEFTKLNEFTKSAEFIKSNEFTNSNEFIKSNEFTNSNEFTKSKGKLAKKNNNKLIVTTLQIFIMILELIMIIIVIIIIIILIK